jgi:autotransporter-associated beta strand protein
MSVGDVTKAIHRVARLILTGVMGLIALIQTTYAGSATWNVNPVTDDWNTAQNWTPETVPDEPTDVATFAVSNITTIATTQFGGTAVGSITFTPGASAYTITFEGNLWARGITNNSGVTQNFTGSGMGFENRATAGENVVITTLAGPGNGSGFGEQSNAGNATIINSGADSVTDAAELVFGDQSGASNSTIVNEQGIVGGGTAFVDSSTAGNSTITTYQNGVTAFFNSSTAGTATLIADGGLIHFENSADGQMARVELTNGGVLDVASLRGTGAMSVGSLEGDSTGSVKLGPTQLSIGGNGLSTTFGGLIFQMGSLVKVGNETLTLTGANTYSGGTTVAGGSLIVQNATGSATGTGSVQVNVGTFGGTGSVTGAVTVGTGTGPHAFLAPGVKGPGSLSTASLLTFKSNSGYKCELAATPHPRVDQVSANGITIENGARFMLRTKGNQTLPIGTIFTVIDNTAATPITGMFANLPDGSTFTVGNNTFQVSYEGGDGNDLTLTVVQ